MVILAISLLIICMIEGSNLTLYMYVGMYIYYSGSSTSINIWGEPTNLGQLEALTYYGFFLAHFLYLYLHYFILSSVLF